MDMLSQWHGAMGIIRLLAKADQPGTIAILKEAAQTLLDKIKAEEINETE